MGFRLGETLFDRGFLEGDVVESAAELVAGHGAVCGEVNESIFLRFEGGQLLPQAVFEFSIGCLQRFHGSGDFASDCVDGFGVEAFGSDGAGHGRFDVVQSHSANGAVSSLFGGAQVVLVRAAIADVLAVDEAAGATFGFALSAGQEAFQVVEVGDVPVALAVASVEDLLDGEECCFVDDRLVASRVERAFVADGSGVVRVTEDFRESARRKRSSRSLRRGAGCQSLLFKKAAKLPDGVLVGCVLRKSPLQDRVAVRVEIDGVDQASVELFADVQVPEFRPSDAAAALNFVGHLDLDVFTGLADLHLVHDVGDGFHGVAHVAVAELLFRGDEGDALFPEPDLGDGSIEVVTEDAGAHVDDDVAHFRVLVDVAHHALELWALLDRLRRVAWVDELLHDGRSELAGGVACPLPLRGDAVAVLVHVGSGVELPDRGYAEVEHRGALRGGSGLRARIARKVLKAGDRIRRTHWRRKCGLLRVVFERGTRCVGGGHSRSFLSASWADVAR